MPSVAEYLAGDSFPVPPVLLERSIDEDVPNSPVPKDVFLSADFARREFDGLWMHVWQAACREREIAAPGDHFEYEIGAQSAVIVRGEDGRIRAFHNVCLHRGNKLVPGQGQGATQFRCSFHGWTWGLDGALEHVPCHWDFPGVDKASHSLREVQCDTWNGFVFVNFDTTAPPLLEFLGETLPRHFQNWPLDQKFKAAHVGRVLNANWKVALEAFLEVYHAFKVHPQLALYSSDANAQYDQYGLHGRMMTAMGVPSPHVIGDLDDAEVVESMIYDQVAGQFQVGQETQVEFPDVGPGQNARTVLADWARTSLQAVSGVDYAGVSDTEMIDAIQYFVFPNLVPWGGASFPIVYRVRPWGSDPDQCLFEIMLMASVPEGADLPPDVPLNMLEPHQDWSEAPELGGLGPVSDQDTERIVTVQQGLKSRGIDHVTFAAEQERNIRKFHANVDAYIAEHVKS